MNGTAVTPKHIILTILTVGLICLTACQPTPEIEAVVRRDNVEKIILDSIEQDDVAPYDYKAPERWEDTITLKGQKKEVTIKADVIIPDTNTFPIAQVVPTTFTQEMADRIREYFIGDRILIERKTELTKADYDEMIVLAKAGYYDGNKHYDTEQSVIDDLIKERENAPEFFEQNVITDFSISGTGFNSVAKDNEQISLSANESRIWYADDYGYFSNLWEWIPSIGASLKDIGVEMRISEQEAIRAADNTLEALGIEGLSAVHAEPVYFYDKDNRDLYKPNRTGYSLQYMRGVEELLPVYMSQRGMAAGQQFDYTPPMDRELMWILVDDTGTLQCLKWTNPMCITDILLENVALLPFDDVKQRLIDQLTYEKAFVDDEAYCFDLTVKEIRLAIDFVPVKDNDTACLYAPCWYLSYQEFVKEGDRDTKKNSKGKPSSHIIINAIDGGSIATLSKKTINIFNEF